MHQLGGRRGAFIPVNCGGFSRSSLARNSSARPRRLRAPTVPGRRANGCKRWTLFSMSSESCRSRCGFSCCGRSSRGDPSARRARAAVDVRVVAATHRDLGDDEPGTFRADSFIAWRSFLACLPYAAPRRSPAIARHLLSAQSAELRFYADALARSAPMPGLW